MLKILCSYNNPFVEPAALVAVLAVVVAVVVMVVVVTYGSDIFGNE